MPASVRDALAGLACGQRAEAATIDPAWGEPGLTAAEKVYGWTSFIVLAMVSGRPENPVNAVAPNARAHCQLRYTVDCDTAAFEPALRAHLDAAGFPEVQMQNCGDPHAGQPHRPDQSLGATRRCQPGAHAGREPQVIPNSGGGLPGDVFMDHLGVPLVWIPHSYNGCKQHGPDEHLLLAPAREGIAAFAGLWWDMGEAAGPLAMPVRRSGGGRDRD